MGVFTKMCCFVGVVLAFAFSGGCPAAAQDSHIATMTDGRFTANLRSYVDLEDQTHGMIDYIEMDIQWWGLMGQPVYIYGFKFVPTGQYEFSDGRRLSRDQLSKYPDLQARFDDLRPSQVEVAFDVGISPRSTGGILTGPTDRLATPNYYVGGGVVGYAPLAKGTVTTSSFLTGPPNQMMQDMSPGSPRDWKSFVDWEFAEDEDNRAQNTFREAQSIEFSNLRITNITLPTSRARTLLQTFELREKKDKDGNMWSDQNTSETKQSGEGLWSDRTAGSSAKTLSDKRGSANIWSDAPSNTSTSASGNMWSDKNTASIFKIETRDYKMGVIGGAGQVLIPFKDWKILKYEHGLARVEMDGAVKEYCDDYNQYHIYWTTTGVVNKNAQWIGTPDRTVKGRMRYYYNGSGIFRGDTGLDDQLERREWEECRDVALSKLPF